ncbi:MAG: acetate kinase [Clostridiales bacterium]|nr:acetate kinase [Clostridiales bacterium]
MYVLVVNAGSSSLKYQLFDMDGEKLIAKGNADRIGIDGVLEHQVIGRDKTKTPVPLPDHAAAIKTVLSTLVDKDAGCLDSISQISAVGHRIVHGGPWLTHPVMVTDESVADLEKCMLLAPLHTKGHLQGIEGCRKAMPGVPQVLVIDTSFHSTMPPKAYTYPIDWDTAQRNYVRRYGFHGTSHRYVSGVANEYLDVPADKSKIITCHIGNGSSITAVQGGKCIDTSMGFTPLDGIIMGSRCGAVDPAIVPHIMEAEHISPDEMADWMNKKCGLLGVSGVSSDMRNVRRAIEEGNERARLAVDILVYEIKKFIGGYTAAMNGLDCLVFTAGIGENDELVRSEVCRDMEFFGIKIDEEKNLAWRSLPVPGDISAPDSRAKVFVIATNEELMIARDTVAMCSMA